MSFKAYNPAWAYREAVHAAATRWHRHRLLTSFQLEAIRVAHPLDFYRPHLFLRIVLFVFTLLGSMAGFAFVALVIINENNGNEVILAILCALASLSLLETAIHGSRFYRAGPDNALLYLALGWLIFLVGYVAVEYLPHGSGGFPDDLRTLLLALLPVLVLLLAATVRYADPLVAAAAFLSYLLLLSAVLFLSDVGRLLLPFALMLACAAAYWLVRKLTHRPDHPYYQSCLRVVKTLALVFFYLAGNYLVVREGNALLSDSFVSAQIPLAGLFYVFMAGIPVLYIYVGLRRPSRIWLVVGLLAVAFSIYTLRYYRALLPPEIAATLAGAALIVLVVAVTRYLRTPRHGLSAAADDDQPPAFDIESLVVAQTAPTPAAAEAPGLQFGGGHSGGGGAEGVY